LTPEHTSRKAGTFSDDLNNALDYAQILEKIFDIANSREYALLETLAYSITRGVLQTFPVAKVSAKVRKYPASLAGKLDNVQVEIRASPCADELWEGMFLPL